MVSHQPSPPKGWTRVENRKNITGHEIILPPKWWLYLTQHERPAGPNKNTITEHFARKQICKYCHTITLFETNVHSIIQNKQNIPNLFQVAFVWSVAGLIKVASERGGLLSIKQADGAILYCFMTWCLMNDESGSQSYSGHHGRGKYDIQGSNDRRSNG